MVTARLVGPMMTAAAREAFQSKPSPAAMPYVRATAQREGR